MGGERHPKRLPPRPRSPGRWHGVPSLPGPAELYLSLSGLGGWWALAGAGRGPNWALRLAERAEDGEAEAEEGDCTHDQIGDPLPVGVFCPFGLALAQRLQDDLRGLFEFVPGQSRFLGLGQRLPQSDLHGEGGEPQVGLLAQIHGHEPALIVKKDHRADLVRGPGFEIILGQLLQPIMLLRGWHSEGTEGDDIDMHVRGGRGGEAGAKARSGFGEEDVRPVEEVSGGCRGNGLAGRGSRGGRCGWRSGRVVGGCGRGEEQAERGEEGEKEAGGGRRRHGWRVGEVLAGL